MEDDISPAMVLFQLMMAKDSPSAFSAAALPRPVHDAFPISFIHVFSILQAMDYGSCFTNIIESSRQCSSAALPTSQKGKLRSGKEVAQDHTRICVSENTSSQEQESSNCDPFPAKGKSLWRQNLRDNRTFPFPPHPRARLPSGCGLCV